MSPPQVLVVVLTHAGDGVMKYAISATAPCGGAIQVTVALPADPVACTSYGTPGAPALSV